MLIFCCIWSPSLCTLALHIAGSLWRLDFNHSSLFRHPLALRSHSGPFPRSFIRYTCIIAYGRFICLPLISRSRATVTAIRITFFLPDIFPRRAQVECLAIHTCTLRITRNPPPRPFPRRCWRSALLRSLYQEFFLLARKGSKFRGTEGSAKWPIRRPGGPKRDLRIAWN